MSDDGSSPDHELWGDWPVSEDVRELAEFIDDRLLVHLEVHWLDVLVRSPTAAELWDLAMDIATDIDYDFEFGRKTEEAEPDSPGGILGR